jgi:tRNA pseudouridine32 synthase/23S rRNA pseudouridine746 synthase
MDQPLPQTIYEDAYLLAINKPAGMLSIRDGYNPDLPYARQILEQQFGRLWIAHRLDRDTSGVLLLARSASCHRALNILFETHMVHKIYHAIVVGVPSWSEHLVDIPLKVDGDRHHRTIVDRIKGKPAQTSLRVLWSSDSISLIEAAPLTGYTHQIRAHLFALGFPILADPLYFIKPALSNLIYPAPSPIQRLALHAYTIEFAHPMTGVNLSLVAPYPPDFERALDALK